MYVDMILNFSTTKKTQALPKAGGNQYLEINKRII